MRQHFEGGESRSTVARRVCFGGIGALIVLMWVLLVEAGIFSQISAGTKRMHSLAVWYFQSGQWRADLDAYVTHAEYLFYPESGAGARVDVDWDED